MNQTPLWDSIKWNDKGLLPVIAQDAESKAILMMAWMNHQALETTIATGQAVYWSRSRQRLWHKGEESGHVQKVHSIMLDCDGDTLLIEVTQAGGIACHTGRASCFYMTLRDGHWVENQPILKAPTDIYR